MSEVDNFFASVKEKRSEAVDYFLSEDFHQALADGLETPEVLVQKGVDQLVAGVLDVVEERYEDIINATVDEDGTRAVVTCVADLSNLYFEQVSN